MNVGGTTALGKRAVEGDTAAQITDVIRAASGQTAQLSQWQNSAGTALVGVTAAGDILPAVDATRTVGNASFRFSLVRAVTITSGDINLESDDKKSSWTIREMPDHILLINRKTGKKFRMAMDPVDE